MILTQAHLPSEWTQFLETIKKLNPIDIETVTQFVKVRVSHFPSDQQMREYFEEVFSKSTNDANRKKWHSQDKNLLIWCMAKHLMSQNRSELIPNDNDWEIVSKILGVDKKLIELKWISLLHSNLKIAPWSKEEDQILMEIANECYQKNNWTELTIKFNSKSQTQRYPKQIRERWNNVLNPNIQRSTWTKEEKFKLISLILNFGKKWSKIQNELQGRSENQIKNQYNGIIRNLKRFNVQETEERMLLQAIIENPDQKLSLTITQFMSEFLKNKEAQKCLETPQTNSQNDFVSVKQVKTDNNVVTNVLIQDQVKEVKETQTYPQTTYPQIPFYSTPQGQQQQQQQIQQQSFNNRFPNNYNYIMNYNSPYQYPNYNYYQTNQNFGFQQYPQTQFGYF